MVEVEVPYYNVSHISPATVYAEDEAPISIPNVLKGHIPPSAPACPTSFQTPLTNNPESLSKVFPSFMTGIGSWFQLTALGGGNYNGTRIQETLVRSSSTCSSGVTNNLAPLCTPSANPLIIGQGGRALDGTTITGLPNVLVDEHGVRQAHSTLGAASTACSMVCAQTYSCNGVPIGAFTVIFSITPGNIAGSTVTQINATEASNRNVFQKVREKRDGVFQAGGLEAFSVGLKRHGISLDSVSLRAALQNPDPEVRSLAAAQLASYHDLVDVQPIRAAMIRETNPQTKGNLATTLASLDVLAGHAAFAEICSDTRLPDYVKIDVARVAFQTGGGECRNAIEVIASGSDDPGSRRSAFLLFPKLLELGAIEPSLRAILSASLSDKDPAVRIAAAEQSLSMFGVSATAAVQSQFASERDPYVRESLQNLLNRYK